MILLSFCRFNLFIILFNLIFKCIVFLFSATYSFFHALHSTCYHCPLPVIYIGHNFIGHTMTMVRKMKSNREVMEQSTVVRKILISLTPKFNLFVPLRNQMTLVFSPLMSCMRVYRCMNNKCLR